MGKFQWVVYFAGTLSDMNIVIPTEAPPVATAVLWRPWQIVTRREFFSPGVWSAVQEGRGQEGHTIETQVGKSPQIYTVC